MHATKSPTSVQVLEPVVQPVVQPVVLAGRYRLGSQLGAGGFGNVWQAEDLLHGEQVAIKMFQSESFDPARVRREIAALRLLRLPGVVRLLDEGVHDGSAFFVMELVDGTPFPGDGTPRTWGGIAPIVRDLLEVLASVHAHGIVHRDLKPSNVLVTPTGQVMVVDFGVAVGMALGSKMTKEGCLVGTPAYLAPEQLWGAAVGTWTDLYSVGLMIYEALSGIALHDDKNFSRLMYKRLHDKLESHVRDSPRRTGRHIRGRGRITDGSRGGEAALGCGGAASPGRRRDRVHGTRQRHRRDHR